MTTLHEITVRAREVRPNDYIHGKRVIDVERRPMSTLITALGYPPIHIRPNEQIKVMRHA